MITTSLTLLSLTALAAAAPTSNPSDGITYPPFKTSKGFRLFVNVTDPSRDFTPSINNQEIFSYVQASGPARAGLGERGNVFYQSYPPNSGVRFPDFGGQILTEALRGPDHVLGLREEPYEQSRNRSTMLLDERDPEPGQIGLQVSPGGYIPQVLAGEISGLPGFTTFAVCNVTVPRLFHGGEAWFLGLEFQIERRYNGEKVPEGCAPVTLLAQCEGLEDVPEGSKAAGFRKYVKDVRCYEDVKAIDWTKYSVVPATVGRF